MAKRGAGIKFSRLMLWLLIIATLSSVAYSATMWCGIRNPAGTAVVTNTITFVNTLNSGAITTSPPCTATLSSCTAVGTYTGFAYTDDLVSWVLNSNTLNPTHTHNRSTNQAVRILGYGVQEKAYSISIAFDNDQIACCAVSSNCVAGATCYASSSATPPSTSFLYSGLNPGGHDTYSYCYNDAGSGEWLECDAGDYMDYWCGTICGPKKGVKSPRTVGIPDPNWNAVYAGELGVGEYPNTATYGCCGDDANEYYKYRNCASSCTTSSTDEACCNLNTDCVYNSVCYSETTSMTAPWNTNHRVSCSGGVWALVEDCSTKASTDTDGGNMPLTFGTVRDYTTSGGASCNYNPITDVCTSTIQLTERYPSGASYLSATHICSGFEVSASGSTGNDPATTDTCTGGTAASCISGAFTRTSGASGTDSCTGTCGTGINSCLFVEWYAIDSGDACPGLDTCTSITYDADTNSNTCNTCRGAGYWAIGGEVAATSCCGDDSGEYKKTRLCSSSCTADSSDDSCCNLNTDCVYNGSCYSETTSMTAPWNIYHRVSCSGGVWALVEDCSTKASTDSDGGDVPLTSGSVRDYTNSSGAACNYNTYADLSVSSVQLTERYPNGVSYLSKTYTCSDFERNSTGSITDDPTITNTCIGGAGANSSLGRFIVIPGSNGTDSCAGICGIGVNSCLFTEWYASDSTDSCPGIDTCISKTYDADTNSNTCLTCRGVGYWNLGGEVAAASCCGDDSGEYKITYDGRTACCNSPTDWVNSTGSCKSLSEFSTYFYGYVRDAGGAGLAGAKVEAIGAGDASLPSTRFSNLTRADGGYSVFVDGNRAYDMAASLEGYKTNTSANLYIAGGDRIRLDFTLRPVVQACEADCTYNNDDTCHAECDLSNGCVFYSEETKNVCDEKQKGWVEELNSTTHVMCCRGAPFSSQAASILYTSGAEAETFNKVRQIRIVFYQGRPLQMIVDVFR